MLQKLLSLLFPPKCVLCRSLLTKEETDICHSCRRSTEEFRKSNRNIPFVEKWTAVWYYKDDVRKSLLRYKFYNARSYGSVYARFLAMKLLQTFDGEFDLISWVPISTRRKRMRGFDQVALLAEHTAGELGLHPVCLLVKHRDTKPQSTMKDAAQRRANVLGAYRVTDRALIAGKRILLLDDIITTGATVSECAKTLLLAGAKEVYIAAVASAFTKKMISR